MNPLDKLTLLAYIARWRLTWDRRDLDYIPRGLSNRKFLTARQAADRIPDGANVISSGMAANTRCSIFFWAIRERFRRTGHPRDLTWIIVGAQGGRGRIPGTLEELGDEGLIRRFIGGHLETVKALLRRGEEGVCELHVMPQGVETYLLEAQARGETSILTETGVGTFLDPRVGNGSPVVRGRGENLIRAEGDRLRYTLPPIQAAMFVLPAADAEGNLYIRNACMVTEARESARAARANKGLVLATVAEIVPKDEKAIWMRAEEVDGIVVNPRNEQASGVQQRRYWPMFTAGGKADPVRAVARLKYVNDVMHITPRRGPADNALARLGAWVFIQNTARGSCINIGVGHPEEVCRIVFEAGLHHDLTFTTETGVFGGLPSPGIFFGSAINPKKIITSAEAFHHYDEHLDTTILGLLQADAQGNVNVSRRGTRVTDYVGCGGFPDITQAARTIVFVGTWMANAKMEIAGGRLRIAKPGTPKFIPAVDEITFCGRQALEAGKRVFYATNVGVFRLTKRGMELAWVMPGVDIRRDIIEGCAMKIVLPKSGEVPTIDESIVTGKGFRRC